MQSILMLRQNNYRYVVAWNNTYKMIKVFFRGQFLACIDRPFTSPELIETKCAGLFVRENKKTKL